MPRPVVSGINDLQSQFPEIAAEAYGWDPTSISAGSGTKKIWRCRLGHTWEVSINSRTNNKSGCPVCSNYKLLVGYNDLGSSFPNIAKEAYGWDPTTVVSGSPQKKDWKCEEGHIYFSSVVSRTNRGTGCPACSGQQVLAGYNDLQTKFPDIAAEAYGWDPSTVTAGRNQKENWKCSEGHIYTCKVAKRTGRGSGCPFCSGRQVLKGYNDLQTKFPDIAAEAYGWDPSTVTPGTHQKKDWKCNNGHVYFSGVKHRTTQGTGCPVCSGQQVLAGYNDLQTKFPDIAAEAYGWDPSTVTPGAGIKKEWKCKEGHLYFALVGTRTGREGGTRCPVCSGHQVLEGYNDLQTKFPDIAAEAYGWDPSTVTPGTHQKKDWRCKEGHIYTSQIANRTSIGTGCPACAEYGFKPDKDAWFYLMERPGEQQLGITNEIDVRLKRHIANGWNLIEKTTVPSKGQKVLDTEKAFKKWLKENIGVVEGTTENWRTTSMEVQSLAELKARSGIETDLF